MKELTISSRDSIENVTNIPTGLTSLRIDAKSKDTSLLEEILSHNPTASILETRELRYPFLQLPPSILLKELYLIDNYDLDLDSLRANANLDSCEILCLLSCSISTLPTWMDSLENLKHFRTTFNWHLRFEDLEVLSGVEKIDLPTNRLKNLRAVRWEEMTELRSLDLSSNFIRRVPRRLLALDLEELDLRHNPLTKRQKKKLSRLDHVLIETGFSDSDDDFEDF